MTAPKTHKPVMAEMLVRSVFGESESFERVCAQRNLSVNEAVQQALQEWMASKKDLFLVSPPRLPRVHLDPKSVPCVGDVPPGQEAHWIEVCEHDLGVLRAHQQSCFRLKDQSALEETNLAIERYIQTLASLRERAA